MGGKRTVLRAALCSAFLAGVTILSAAPAGATIDGNCEGSGAFSPGPSVDARTAERVEIPLDATVQYRGAVNVDPPSEGRPISGFVSIKLPFGNVNAGSWDDPDATFTEESGSYTYDLPSVLASFDVTVAGFHFENGQPFCSGEVTLRLEGSNPLALPAVVFTALSIPGVFLAIRATPGPTGIPDEPAPAPRTRHDF